MDDLNELTDGHVGEQVSQESAATTRRREVPHFGEEDEIEVGDGHSRSSLDVPSPPRSPASSSHSTSPATVGGSDSSVSLDGDGLLKPTFRIRPYDQTRETPDVYLMRLARIVTENSMHAGDIRLVEDQASKIIAEYGGTEGMKSVHRILNEHIQAAHNRIEVESVLGSKLPEEYEQALLKINVNKEALANFFAFVYEAKKMKDDPAKQTIAAGQELLGSLEKYILYGVCTDEGLSLKERKLIKNLAFQMLESATYFQSLQWGRETVGRGLQDLGVARSHLDGDLKRFMDNEDRYALIMTGADADMPSGEGRDKAVFAARTRIANYHALSLEEVVRDFMRIPGVSEARARDMAIGFRALQQSASPGHVVDRISWDGRIPALSMLTHDAVIIDVAHSPQGEALKTFKAKRVESGFNGKKHHLETHDIDFTGVGLVSESTAQSFLKMCANSLVPKSDIAEAFHAMNEAGEVEPTEAFRQAIRGFLLRCGMHPGFVDAQRNAIASSLLNFMRDNATAKLAIHRAIY